LRSGCRAVVGGGADARPCLRSSRQPRGDPGGDLRLKASTPRPRHDPRPRQVRIDIIGVTQEASHPRPHRRAPARDEYGRAVPAHVEAALRNYLKGGIFAHGFARVYCGNCRHCRRVRRRRVAGGAVCPIPPCHADHHAVIVPHQRSRHRRSAPPKPTPKFRWTARRTPIE
jgi:hypothetical protein